jgi:integrase/recombinase XerD
MLICSDASTSKTGGCPGGRTRRGAQRAARSLSRSCPSCKLRLKPLPASDALTFLTTDYGRPFASPAALGNKFADWCKQAGLAGRVGDDGRTKNFRAHGLRKAACRRLAEAGCSAPEIMAVSGHSRLNQVQVYIDDVDQEHMAEAAMGRITYKTHKPNDPRSQTGS